MTTPSNPNAETPLLGRRAALVSLASTFACVACGGGGDAAQLESQSQLAGAIAVPAPTPPMGLVPTRLTLHGSSMIAPNGSPIILRGINEGTWGEMQSYDAAAIAAQGGRVVRLPIRWWGLYGGNDVESRQDSAPGHFKPDHLATFLQQVQWCIQAGLWVIPFIDSNCGQNGTQSQDMENYCDPNHIYPNGRNFWTDLSQRQLFKECWVYLANILKNYSQIAFYEILPEPLAGAKASDAPAVSAFYQELMAAIEDGTGDRRTPFLIGARDSYNIKVCDEAYIAAPRWANRVVYTGNLFLHPQATQTQTVADLESRLNALATMKKNRNVPVFIQQFGVRTGDDPTGFYLDKGLSSMNAAGIGYTGWQWRQNTSSMDEYAVIVKDPKTGADIVKTQVLALYSKYWKANLANSA